MRKHALGASLCALSLHFAARPASGQTDIAAYAREGQRSALRSSAHLPRMFASGGSSGVPLVVRSRTSKVEAPELTSIGLFATGELDASRVLELSAAHPDWSFEWAPPRHVLLDRVDGWIHADSVRKQTKASGRGVVVGIVDTGADLTHADLQTSDHKTRVAWLFDIARNPARLHAELEKRYGCTTKNTACAIYDADDLDERLTSGADIPTDPFGHGTHVTSLAAGNGLASKVPRYVGVAPEATIVVARVASPSGSILDSDVLRAVKFVFDRADDLGMPAVVNLSLGSDFGAHDGSSALEAGLASMVGADAPGRAIVVAAGNSAGLYEGVNSPYPGPFGVHTEVHVPEHSVSRVPLVTPALAGPLVHGTAYVWMQFREGDEVSVGLEDKTGTRVAQVSPGHAYSNETDDSSAPDVGITLINSVDERSDASRVNTGAHAAVLSIDGTWPENSDFALRFEGHGSVELWVQGAGDLNPELSVGALFPRGEKQGTINVPASASGLIAVGASLNRTSWVDAVGTQIDMPDLGATKNAPLDSIAYFSSGGPNALGALKPDIVAPGVWVVGAMARAADPRTTASGLFASMGRCPDDEQCFVVDDTHAVTSGTSMSSPIVAGAIALLFERDPTLTQDGVRAILQAGARKLQGLVIDERQIGPGALDLEAAFEVQDAAQAPAERTPNQQSWLTISESYARPDPSWPLTGYLDLRDRDGRIADGFDAHRLGLRASPAEVREPLTRLAPGFYRFALAAPANSGGQTLHIEVTFDSRVLAARDLPIAVDRSVAEGGVSARGGCAFGKAAGSTTRPLALAPWLLALGVARRRRSASHIRAK